MHFLPVSYSHKLVCFPLLLIGLPSSITENFVCSKCARKGPFKFFINRCFLLIVLNNLPQLVSSTIFTFYFFVQFFLPFPFFLSPAAPSRYLSNRRPLCSPAADLDCPLFSCPMCSSFSLSFLLLAIFSAFVSSKNISTSYGTLQGLDKATSSGKEAHIFLVKYGKFLKLRNLQGIPQTEPPLGENRFKILGRPRKWSGVLNATEYRQV